jgi:hypothetical protein
MTNGFKQGFMTIAGNAFNLESKGNKIEQIFFELLIPLPIAEPVELGILDSIIPVKDQTEIITEVSAVYQQVQPLRGADNKVGRFVQPAVEIPL